ncbi:MAG: hypothetical protein BWK76_01615 [Desulfobulbaceae bacterium A2]|nr:MAG: hypothetical protein BWK76_01615 [Desulfobulbaceae bacterium A2]
MRQQSTLVRVVRLLSVVSLLALAGIIVLVQAVVGYREFVQQATKMRGEYVAQQKAQVKREVERVVALIDSERTQTGRRARESARQRVNEAWEVARNLQLQYQGRMAEADIVRLIVESLRPVRFNDGHGYFFICDRGGHILLVADRPELEGRHYSAVANAQEHEALRRIIAAADTSAEDTLTYRWSKPGAFGASFEKISFIKRFEPFDLIIGTGVYLDDIEEQAKSTLLDMISRIRFGEEGYIFVNRMNGDALVSNGRVFDGHSKLWKIFDQQEQAREVFAREYQAAMTPHGDYISYSWIKLSNAAQVSEKASFVAGVPAWNWLVGAGVYLDDVEADIAVLQGTLRYESLRGILLTLLGTGLMIALVLVVLQRISRRVVGDIELLTTMFNRAATRDTAIALEQVRFEELRRIAGDVNQVLHDKLAEKEQLAVTLRSIGDCVITTDLAGAVVLINREAERLTGWSQDEARGKPVQEVFGVVDNHGNALPEHPVTRVLASGQTIIVPSHVTLLARDGHRHLVEDSVAPIFDNSNNMIGIVLVFRDVTEKVRTAEELRKAEKLRSVGILAGGIAHDFNNMLAAILGNVELAELVSGPGGELTPILHDLRRAAGRAKGLTQQLLTFAKGGDPLLKTASLQDIVVESADFALHGSTVACEYRFDEALWPVEVDSGQLAQVVQNLILNAVQAMMGGGTIRVGCSNVTLDLGEDILLPPGRYVCLTIRDGGCGIPAEHLDKIFDPYFSTKQTGSGLGLAVCHSVIEKHHGRISVLSTEGIGTTFIILLPASVKTLEHVAPAAAGGVSTGKKLCVLVMDDDEMIRTVVKNMLEHLGHEVLLTSEGQEAVRQYAACRSSNRDVDLVLMDLTIPGGMGGKDAAQAILRLDPAARLVVASGYSNDPVLAHYRDYGFIAAIAKPFRLDELVEVLKSC